MSDAPVIAPVIAAVSKEVKESVEQAPPAPEVKKHKIKIDNEEAEVDESELIRGYSRSQASMKRFQEAYEKEQLVEKRAAKFKQNPIDVLAEYGHDPEELALAIMRRQVELSLAEPEDKDQAELKRYRDQEAKAKADKENQELSAKAQVYANEVSVKIAEAMEGTGLSKDPYTVRAAALFVRSCVLQGFEPDATEIREAIEGRVKSDYKSQVQGRKGKDLVDWLGEETVNEIRKFDLSRLRPNREARAPIPQHKPQESASPRRESKWEIAERVKKWQSE